MANAAASPVTSSVSAIGGGSGGPSGCAVQRREPRHPLGHGREAGPVRVRTVLAEPGDPGDHQPRVAVEQRGGREAEALERTGPEVLDEHVGIVDERQQDVPIGLDLEVEDDRALVAIDELPPQAFAVARVAPCQTAEGVAVGAFDLDDVGAVVGEVARAVRTGENGRQVERHGAPRAAAGMACPRCR